VSQPSVRDYIAYYNRAGGPGTGVGLFLSLVVIASVVITAIACR
jgi:hypothetical protein